MSTPEPRTRRIRRDGTEVRQLLDFVLEGMVEQSKRTAAALLEAGYDEADVARVTDEWWRTHAVDALRGLALELEVAIGVERGRQLLERAIAQHDSELVDKARSMVVDALKAEEKR